MHESNAQDAAYQHCCVSACLCHFSQPMYFHRRASSLPTKAMADENMDLGSAETSTNDVDIPKKIMYAVPEEMQRKNDDDAYETTPLDAPPKEAPDVGTPPPAPPIEYGDSIRPVALHLQGELITQLSTSRLMAFVAYSGAQAKGVEWINDTRCVIVFESPERALEGLKHLCYDAVENGVILEPNFEDPESPLLRARLVMAFPRKLYNTIEQQAAAELPDLLSKLAEEQAKFDNTTEPVPEIYRDMELEELERRILSEDHRRVKQLRQGLWIRFALHNYDTKSPRSASKSNWYKQHGRGAGKEIVTRLLDVGEPTSQRRHRRSRRERRERASRKESLEQMDEEYTPLSLRDRIGGRRDRDWDGDNNSHDTRERSMSPDSNGGVVRIRGRGSVRAPQAESAGWGDED